MRALFMPAAAAVLLTLGCASGSGTPPDGSPAPENVVVLQVTNNTWNDVDVFVIANTVRARLGDVESQNTARLAISQELWATGSIQIRVEGLGGESVFVTDAIEIQGGQRVKLVLEENPALSHWQVERAEGE